MYDQFLITKAPIDANYKKIRKTNSDFIETKTMLKQIMVQNHD